LPGVQVAKGHAYSALEDLAVELEEAGSPYGLSGPPTKFITLRALENGCWS